MTVADRPNTLMMRSSGLPTLSAATTPPRMPSGTTSTKASAASFSELTECLAEQGPTGDWYWYDVPKLPVTKWPIHVPYWEISGLSVPS